MPEGSVCHFRVGSRAGSKAMSSRAASLRRISHSSVMAEKPLKAKNETPRRVGRLASLQRGRQRVRKGFIGAIEPQRRHRDVVRGESCEIAALGWCLQRGGAIE